MNARSFPTTVALVAAGAALVACQPAEQSQQEEGAAEGAAGEESTAGHVVEVTAVDYAFQAPDTIPSGWVTFRMENEGTESHHFQLERLPEGKTFADWQEAFQEPADSLMHMLDAGKMDSAEVGKAYDRIVPDWAKYSNLEPRGGVGLAAPGHTGQTTHQVDPGHYVMICVIDAPSGLPHANLGMVAGVVAVEDSSKRSPPTPDATVRGIRREIRMDGTLTRGTQTIGFRAEEVPEGLRDGTDGHYSVWLARLDDTTDVRDVAEWDGRNPAPYEGLGGFEYLPPDRAAYVTVDVQPGRYAWLWVYHGMDVYGGDEPVVKSFTVE